MKEDDNMIIKSPFVKIALRGIAQNLLNTLQKRVYHVMFRSKNGNKIIRDKLVFMMPKDFEAYVQKCAKQGEEKGIEVIRLSKDTIIIG